MGVLDLAAGLERFHAQAAGIALDIEAFRADQAVWLGVMGALGYPRNKRAFRMFRPAELIGDSAIVVMGSARASETVVNVLLPTVFALAAGSGHSSMGLKNNVLALYDAHPKLAENSVTREAKVALGVDYEVPKIASARDQQGLIILYREMFRSGIRPHQRRLPGV
jgi:hypothetical protein